MNRIQANREVPELYETTEILTKVRNNYLRAIDLTRTEESVTTVDGNRPIAEVADEIYNIAISLQQG
jgi:thymidylate kinase